MNTEKPTVIYGEANPKPEFYGEPKEALDKLGGSHKVFDEDLEKKRLELEKSIQESRQRKKDEVREKELRRQQGPKIELEGKPAFGTVANTLKSFYPQANHEQRRQMVKNSRKKGKGFNKPAMNKHERKRKNK